MKHLLRRDTHLSPRLSLSAEGPSLDSTGPPRFIKRQCAYANDVSLQNHRSSFAGYWKEFSFDRLFESYILTTICFML